MKIKVVYHSLTGNTKKVAETIAKAANVAAENIEDSKVIQEPVDLLFIGDGVYFGDISKTAKKFIDTLNTDYVKNIAVFGTLGGQDNGIVKMKEMLEKKGLNVINEDFRCKGQAWLIMNRKHPDETDMKNASDFAAHMMQMSETR